MSLFALPPNYAEGIGSVFHVTDTPRLALGQCYWNEDDQQKLRYVRFAEAIKEGAALTTKLPMGTETNIAAAAAAGSTTITVLGSGAATETYG